MIFDNVTVTKTQTNHQTRAHDVVSLFGPKANILGAQSTEFLNLTIPGCWTSRRRIELLPREVYFSRGI
jgi:hypothetical protein